MVIIYYKASCMLGHTFNSEPKAALHLKNIQILSLTITSISLFYGVPQVNLTLTFVFWEKKIKTAFYTSMCTSKRHPAFDSHISHIHSMSGSIKECQLNTSLALTWSKDVIVCLLNVAVVVIVPITEQGDSTNKGIFISALLQTSSCCHVNEQLSFAVI